MALFEPITRDKTDRRTKPKDRPKDRLKRPIMYVVIVHNDPFTPRGFVVDVLTRYFQKSQAEASRIMMLAHNYGIGVVAKYSKEIAETKATIANEFARANGYPLNFTFEEE